MPIHQVLFKQAEQPAEGKVKDRRNRDLGSRPKTASSAVGNVTVKFVSQEALGRGPDM